MNHATTLNEPAAVPKKRSLPGGIRHQVLVLDKDHPLATVDPILSAVLEELEPRILEVYSDTKLLTPAPSPPGPGSVEFVPISFTTQVVAGTNYFVKLQVVHSKNKIESGAVSEPSPSADPAKRGEYIHVKIFSQPWTHTAKLTGLAVNKHLNDSLEETIPHVLDA
ncbi:hypothetical protein BGZ58_008993 [Dissophora ornata]|nr:hypothetical protein BGZ58_008993 [Dissophora ornata]